MFSPALCVIKGGPHSVIQETVICAKTQYKLKPQTSKRQKCVWSVSTPGQGSPKATLFYISYLELLLQPAPKQSCKYQTAILAVIDVYQKNVSGAATTAANINMWGCWLLLPEDWGKDEGNCTALDSHQWEERDRSGCVYAMHGSKLEQCCQITHTAKWYSVVVTKYHTSLHFVYCNQTRPVLLQQKSLRSKETSQPGHSK
jgi:hypothetical protein